jgi:hypothetical protein
MMEVACPTCGEALCDIMGSTHGTISTVRVLLLCMADHQFYVEVKQGGETGKEVTVRLTTDAELDAEEEARLAAHADQEFEG